MDRFTKLCLKYHTPKVIIPENPLSHNYAPTYNRLLEGRVVKRILEIGLGYAHLFHDDYPHAGSLLIWEELFPGAEIFGLDIRPDTLRRSIARDRYDLIFRSLQEDLRRAASVIGGNLDLIVDDGSHVWEHQKLTARVFVPELSRTGAYLIEDVKPRANYDDFPFDHEVIECSKGRTEDDRLILVEARA